MTINDDELILYRFRDGLEPDDIERIERAIASDADVAARYRALTEDVAKLRDIDTPVPASAVRRWRNALEDASRPAPIRRPFPMAARFAVAASAAVFAFGIAWFAHREPEVPVSQAPLTVAAKMDRALLLHLVGLEGELEQLPQATAAERGDTIRRLIEQNRIQTLAAERTGAARDARVLRAFTVALQDIAAEDKTNGKLRAALSQLDFEMRVTQARLASSSPSIGALLPEAL